MIIEQFTDDAGKIRILWQTAQGNNYWYKFAAEPTTQQLTALGEASDTAATENAVQPLTLSIIEYKGTLVQFVEKVKATPNVTLNQYNTYLGTLPWYEAAIIRAFVFIIAQRLAEKKDVTLANLTESTVLQAVRDFLVNTPGRLILNENNI